MLLQKDGQLSNRGANAGVAASPTCLLTTPSVAPVTSSLFHPAHSAACPAWVPARRLRQQPTAGSPTPHGPTLSHSTLRAGEGLRSARPRHPAHVRSCQPFVMPLLEKDLPTIQENDGTCLTATLPGYVQRLGGTKNKQKLFLKSQNV